MKKVISLLLALVMCLTLCVPAFAMESRVPLEATVTEDISIDESVSRGGDADLWRYRKVNVSESYAWTDYKRVSDNVVTGSAGGSISCDRSVSFSGSVSGNTANISVGAGVTLTSSIGYTLNVGSNQRVYMGYRAYIRTETGTREKYNHITGIVESSNTYVAKQPQYGEYALLNG